MNKKERQAELTEQIKTTTTRVGDTVHFQIPRVKFKDTTIYSYNRQGTRIGVRYDNQGQIDLAECISSAIDEIKEENRRWRESEEEKEKTEELDTNINWTWIIIGLGGFAFLLGKKT